MPPQDQNNQFGAPQNPAPLPGQPLQPELQQNPESFFQPTVISPNGTGPETPQPQMTPPPAPELGFAPQPPAEPMPAVSPPMQDPMASDGAPVSQPVPPAPPQPTMTPPGPAMPAFMNPDPPAPAQPVAPVPAAAAMPMEGYSSNPFLSTVKGLGLALTANPLSSLTVGLIAIVVGGGAVFLALVLGMFLPAIVKITLMLLAFVVMILVLIRATAAVAIVHQKSIEGQRVTGRQALGPLAGEHLGSYVGAILLTVLFVLLGMILLIIPGLVIAARLALVPFVVYGEGLGGMAAVKRSWQLTRGHTWEMLGVNFASSLVIGGSGGLLSFTGSLAGPANRYAELTAAEKNGMSTGKMHWLNYGIVLIFIAFMVGYIGLIGFAVKNGIRARTGTTSTSGNYSGSTQSSGAYCYFVSATSSETNCVTKTECDTTPACAEFYNSILQGSTTPAGQ